MASSGAVRPPGRIPPTNVPQQSDAQADGLPHAPTMPPTATAPVASSPRRPRRVGKAIATLLLVLVLGVAALAVVLYATDYEVDATVQRTDCSRGQVDVTTKLFGIDHTVTGVPMQQCLVLRAGNFVEYHIRSAHTRLFDVEGGDCIYDSVTGVC